mmetsp:Transcript_1684/g.3835  ORF Transcript_1684/g.3835 Transcript_1684/m.3835 type:complete len:452 (-) Transcript_1684:207-1562(-)
MSTRRQKRAQGTPGGQQQQQQQFVEVDMSEHDNSNHSNVHDDSDDSSGSYYEGSGIAGSGGAGAGGPSFFSSSRNRKFMFLMVLLATVFYFINSKEQKVLDESQYEDARKQAIRKRGHHNRYSTIDTYKRPKGPTGQFVLQPESEFTPAIAWLMSFPNSGTSFTMTMVARSSNRSFATNYGDEVTAHNQSDTLSIYPRRPEGPYWAGMSGQIASPRELPDKYIITKTHCGSRCVECGPDEYVEGPIVFLRRCTLGHAYLTPAKQRRRYDVEYPPERVQKAIHLIRNPMHNTIARFHLERRHKEYKNKTDYLETHPNNEVGFQEWCKDFKQTYAKEDEEFFKDGVPVAPCHGEFYKWTQWHNLVHQSLDLIPHKVPVLTVYYEDYKTNFNATAMGILNFLELDLVGELREFTARSDYDSYFTKDQLKEIKKLVKDVATEKTWSLVKHYFDDV